MRTLLIVLALVLIVTIGKRLLLTPRPPRRRRVTSADMVQCAHCGMYIPQDEAISAEGRYYCSAEHRTEGRT